MMHERPRVVVIANAGALVNVAVSRALRSSPVRIAVVEQERREADLVAGEIAQLLGESAVIAVPLDLAGGATGDDVCTRILSSFGHIDIWVNGYRAPKREAGEVLHQSGASSGVAGVLRRTIDCCSIVGAYMLTEGRGVIVNLHSVAADHHERGQVAESTLAGGVRALTHALGVEWASRGVRVVGIACGGAAFDDDRGAVKRRAVPVGRGPTPEDVADAVAYVTSERASFLTAETLVLDGAWTAYQMF
jgi:NAD(P)-dependent dehydrogenase (short-subunit alcohol dehydrogenase family)